MTFFGLCCQVIFVSKYQERIKCPFICMLFSSILLNLVCLCNNFLIYNWGNITFSSKNCLFPKGLFFSFGNYGNNSNINKPLLQHHGSQVCFYWSRILNFYSGKDMENIFFIWKAQMERDYIINHPLCHDTNFHFPLGLFKMIFYTLSQRLVQVKT